MAPKVAARTARDPRQFRLGQSNLVPSPAINAQVSAALSAGAAFRRVGQSYELGSTGLRMTSGIRYTDLGRFALQRVAELGLDKDEFELKARELTINVPTVRVKKLENGARWKRGAPAWATLSAEQMGSPSMLMGASTAADQIQLAQQTLANYTETLEVQLRYNLPILHYETDEKTWVLVDDQREATFNVRAPDFDVGGQVSFDGSMLDQPLLGTPLAPDDMWCKQLVDPDA